MIATRHWLIEAESEAIDPLQDFIASTRQEGRRRPSSTAWST